MRRPETALAYGTASLMFIFALPGGAMAGEVGQWASAGMHTAFGHAAWLIPAWLADAARRAWLGAPRDPRRFAAWVLHTAAACMTLDLFAAHGGWIGAECASAVQITIGIGAYLIAIGVWIVAGMRALGPRRVQQVAAYAYTVTRQALEHRPVLLLATSTQPLRAEIVDMPPGAMPVPARAPAPSRAVTPAPPLPPTTASMVQRAPSKWQLPSVSMLPPAEPHHIDQGYLEQVARHLAAKLSSYDIRAQVAPAHEQGSLVHRFEITPAHGQKLKPIEACKKDLAALFAGLQFVDRNGSGKLGLEIPVPESHRTPIQMREVLDTPKWIDSKAALPLALGVTTAGDPVVVDLATCPHLLVAGTSGAGKSMGLHVMIASLLLKHSPADLQLVMVDPKFVELAVYEGLPHLRGPIATNQAEALELLREAVDEMEARYAKFRAAGVRNLPSYNAQGRDRIPRIVIVIEEYADLTMKNADEVEELVCRLAQKARGAGIHVILATQRPSVDVITGVIKGNFDGRIAYRVAARVDSETILGNLDGAGAHQLIGRGDSLCRVPDLGPTPVRVHGAFIDADNGHVLRICEAWRAQTTSSSPARKPTPPPLPTRVVAEPSDDDTCITVDESDVEPAAKATELTPSAETSDQSPDHYARAVAYASEHGHVSARKLEDALNVGTKRANQLTARMREAGLIEPGGPKNSYRFTQTQLT